MTDQQSRLKWGVLGTGRITRKLAPALQQARSAELAAVASRDRDRAAAWATDYCLSRSYGSYQELVDDDEIDAVYIALPPSLHEEWTTRCAERGKQVLCEKPLACDTAQAQRMVDACRQQGVQLMDGVMWYHHPRAEQIRKVLQSGELGRLRRLTSAFSFCWDPLPQQEFRLHRQFGGGSLLDLGWYCVGAALWAFGEFPQRVWGTARFREEVDMSFSGLLWFDNERTASFDCGFDTAMRKWLEIAGTAGSLVCDDFTRPWNLDKTRFWLHGTDGKAQEVTTPPAEQEVCMVEAFSRAVLSGQHNPEWPASALNTQRVCEALDRSAREGVVVEVT